MDFLDSVIWSTLEYPFDVFENTDASLDETLHLVILFLEYVVIYIFKKLF